MAQLRQGAVTFKGNPIELIGPALRVGETAPAFTLQGADLSDVQLASAAGKTRILITVPSLDTAVCSLETKKFNDEVAKRGNLEVWCISMDLPFAMKRWCGAENATTVRTLSAHRDTAFAEQYGVLIAAGGPLARLLARAVFVVGSDGKLRHVEYVKEMTHEPDYAAALDAAD